MHESQLNTSSIVWSTYSQASLPGAGGGGPGGTSGSGSGSGSGVFPFLPERPLLGDLADEPEPNKQNKEGQVVLDYCASKLAYRILLTKMGTFTVLLNFVIQVKYYKAASSLKQEMVLTGEYTMSKKEN